MIEKEIKIEGMSCNHCMMSVKEELAKVPGVRVKDVRIGSAIVAYDEKSVTEAQLAGAIQGAGYSVIG